MISFPEKQYIISKCLVALYNKARNDSDNIENRDEKVFQGIALTQLVEYIEETNQLTRFLFLD